MDPWIAEFLISESGTLALTDTRKMLEQRVPQMTVLGKLRKKLSMEEASAVWSVCESRQKAAKKLGPDAKTLILEREGSEMASGVIAAKYHANLLANLGCRSVVDLCAGLGLDTVAFARQGISVVAYEIDSARAKLLQENVRRLGVDHLVQVINADVTSSSIPTADAAFFDPARRTAERRWNRGGDDTIPPITFIGKLQEAGFSAIIAKLSPAVDRQVAVDYSAELQFLSIEGECKEGLLMISTSAIRPTYKAVKPSSGEFFVSDVRGELQLERGPYIWEPDPAIARAGLTGALAQSLRGWQCDAHNDYFFTNEAQPSPFATCYRVKIEMAYSRRSLQNALAGAGRVILKQRGFPETVDDVRSRLKLAGSTEEIVILAGFNRLSYAFVVEQVPAQRELDRP